MAKTNFTKVEEALNEGLRKIKVGQLLETADTVSGKKEAATEAESLSQRQLLLSLEQDLKRLRKKMPDMPKVLGFSQSKVKELLEHFDRLTPEDWEEIKKVKKHCELLKEELAKQDSSSNDEDLVSKERKKHINKRFNVNDKWLPLR